MLLGEAGPQVFGSLVEQSPEVFETLVKGSRRYDVRLDLPIISGKATAARAKPTPWTMLSAMISPRV